MHRQFDTILLAAVAQDGNVEVGALRPQHHFGIISFATLFKPCGKVLQHLLLGIALFGEYCRLHCVRLTLPPLDGGSLKLTTVKNCGCQVYALHKRIHENVI